MSLFYPQVTHNIGGNTSGTTSNVFGNTLFLAGGNNITLSQDANTITISAGASGGGGDAIRGIAAGGSTQTTNTVNFSNSNGFSFGFTSTDVTASHNALTSQSTQYLAVELGGNTSGTTSFNASNNASLFLHGGNNITLSGNGSSITISAGASATGTDAIRGIAAGGSTQTTNTVNFSNANGMSFGYGAGANSTALTASHNGLTSQSSQYLAITLGGNTAGTTSFNATNNASIFLHGGNNITLSGSGSTITISAGGVPNVSKYPFEYVSRLQYPFRSASISATSNTSSVTVTVLINYKPIIANVYYNQIEQGYSMFTNIGTGSGTHGMAIGFYTRNGNTMSLVSSFHNGMLNSQNSATAVSFYYWWGTDSNANSSSTAGNVISLFTGNKRILFWTGTDGTLTSGNYYFVQAHYRRQSNANVYATNNISGEFAATQLFFNASTVPYGIDLMGQFTSSTSVTNFINGFFLPNSFPTSIITVSFNDTNQLINYGVDLLSKF